MQKSVAFVAALLTIAFAAPITAQQPAAPAPIKRTILQRVDVPGANYETVTGIAEISVDEEGTRVTVRRTEEPLPGPATAPASAPDADADEPAAPADDGALRIEAPMVGTFYRAPQPGAPPFVEEGDAVAPGQTLCILEAMKLMNEVKAEIEGIVRAIHVQNGQPVEFGQALFDLEPALAQPLDAL